MHDPVCNHPLPKKKKKIFFSNFKGGNKYTNSLLLSHPVMLFCILGLKCDSRPLERKDVPTEDKQGATS